MDKRVVSIAMVIGATIGGYIPALFGARIFSGYAIVGTFLGGSIAIWLSVKFLG